MVFFLPKGRAHVPFWKALPSPVGFIKAELG